MTPTVFYSVVAPRWRARGRPRPVLNPRRLIRWQIVCEIRRPAADAAGISTWSYVHHSLHWTMRAAFKAADKAANAEDGAA